MLCADWWEHSKLPAGGAVAAAAVPGRQFSQRTVAHRPFHQPPDYHICIRSGNSPPHTNTFKLSCHMQMQLAGGFTSLHLCVCVWVSGWVDFKYIEPCCPQVVQQNGRAITLACNERRAFLCLRHLNSPECLPTCSCLSLASLHPRHHA